MCDAVRRGTHSQKGVFAPTDNRADRHAFRVGWLGPAPARVGRSTITTSQQLEITSEANADNARQLRVRVQQWLRGLGAPANLVDDLTMAVYEALANVVEHAYQPDHPDPVMRLAARRVQNQLLITITDHGRWRPPSDEPGYRGRGLAMMRSLAGDVQLHHTADGTTVQLRASLQQRSDERVRTDTTALP